MLDGYLSRELAAHVGDGRRFSQDEQRRAFDQAIATHCREASLIVEDFAAGWYGKTVWREQSFGREAVAKFGAYALTKLRKELSRRRDAG